MKTCGVCKRELPLTEFHRQTKAPDGLTYRCKECAAAATKRWRKARGPGVIRADSSRRKYGLTREIYDEMVEKQEGLCAICKQPETAGKNSVTFSLSVDHCHVTGTVRGLLCMRCNHLLGNARESTEVLRAAIDYLEHYPNAHVH